MRPEWDPLMLIHGYLRFDDQHETCSSAHDSDWHASLLESSRLPVKQHISIHVLRIQDESVTLWSPKWFCLAELTYIRVDRALLLYTPSQKWVHLWKNPVTRKRKSVFKQNFDIPCSSTSITDYLHMFCVPALQCLLIVWGALHSQFSGAFWISGNILWVKLHGVRRRIHTSLLPEKNWIIFSQAFWQCKTAFVWETL